MTRNILQRLADYADRFQKNDEEVYVQKIDNDHALEWMEKQIPLLDCPEAGNVYEEAFRFLMDEDVFFGKCGLRTADVSHPRY